MISIESAYISFYEHIIVIWCLSHTILKTQHYIVTVPFPGHPRSKVMVPNERLYAFLSMNNCNYISNRNYFKDGSFL